MQDYILNLLKSKSLREIRNIQLDIRTELRKEEDITEAISKSNLIK